MVHPGGMLLWSQATTESNWAQTAKLEMCILDTLESTQWAPRDPCRDLRGKRSPLLPLQASPDSPGESGMETRDLCLPLRGILGPGHTPR